MRRVNTARISGTFFLLAILAAARAQAEDLTPSESSLAPVPTKTQQSTAEAEVRDDSLWEAGVVGGGVYVPDYPAAAQKHGKWVAAPYVIYRGKIFRADREGARARLVKGRWFDVEMSFAAAFATKSDENAARQGMPNLDYTLEAGPRLSVLLSQLRGYGTMRFYLPARMVFSTDLNNFHYRGLTYTPAIYTQLEPFLRPGWIGIAQLSGRFTNRQVASYFYDVAPEFVTPDRPGYDARAGYMGSDLFLGVAIPVGLRLRIFGGGQYYYDGGSANSASPLFKRKSDFSVGIGLSYAVFRSAKPAKN